MNTPLTDDDIDRLARRRAGAKLGWYIHACVYLVVNLFLFELSEYSFGARRWSVYPLLGWGVGLALLHDRPSGVGVRLLLPADAEPHPRPGLPDGDGLTSAGTG